MGRVSLTMHDEDMLYIRVADLDMLICFLCHRCRIQELGVALTRFSKALAELRDEVVAAQGTDSGV